MCGGLSRLGESIIDHQSTREMIVITVLTTSSNFFFFSPILMKENQLGPSLVALRYK